jgi:hypothetical protein
LRTGRRRLRWKDYRASGRTRPKVMRLPAGEFTRIPQMDWRSASPVYRFPLVGQDFSRIR